jgi:hypothetical protein
MTEAEVKAAMKGGLEATGSPPGTQSYTPFRIKSVKVGPAIGDGSLGFDLKKKTLERVFLNLSRKSGDDPLAEITPDERAARAVAYEYLSKQLIEKYGKPIDETGMCPTSDEMIDHFVKEPLNTLKCSRVWRQPSQTIRMDFSLVGNSLFLTIEYKSRSASRSEL